MIEINGAKITEEDFAKLAKEHGYIKEHKEPELYCGLTNEQWQQVIEGRLLVQVRDTLDSEWVTKFLSYISFQNEYMFVTLAGAYWKYCRIHPSQPQFWLGEKPYWLSSHDTVIVKKKLDSGGHELDIMKACDIDWNGKDSNIIRWQRVKL